MRALAISAANIRHQPEGTSVRLAKMALQTLVKLQPELETELITLVNKTIEPCIGCGACAPTGRCPQFGDDFAAIYERLLAADLVVIVAPHYAPVPAKLCALFERVESISFLAWHNDLPHQFPLKGKPYAVIGHGGGPPTTWPSYSVIFDPIKNALGFPVSMQPVATGEWPQIGVMVGPSEVKRAADSVFPIQIYDDDLLERKVDRLCVALWQSLQQEGESGADN